MKKRERKMSGQQLKFNKTQFWNKDEEGRERERNENCNYRAKTTANHKVHDITFVLQIVLNLHP